MTDTAARPRASASGDTPRLLINTIWYLIPLVFTRGLTVILTPFYTRALSQSDFALVSTANALAAILTIVLGLGLYGVATRLVVEHSGKQQRELLGTIFLASTAFSTLATIGLLAIGYSGRLTLFATLQFDPHLKLVLWIGLLNTFSPLPTTVFAAQDRPRLSSGLGVISSVALILLTIYFVRFRGEGAVGVLRATAFAAGISAMISVAASMSFTSFDANLPGLRSSLAMGVPLVPHLAANWALSISDRLVLERFVSSAEMSQYSLAYLFSLGLSLCSFSINAAFSPLAQRKLLDREQQHEVPALGSLAFATTVVIAFFAICFAPEAIMVLAPPAYAPAFRFVPWVIIGALFQSLYQIVAVATWFSKRTTWIAVVTLIAATTNISLNLLFVPKFGAIAAALSTLVAYAVSALLHGLFANRLHPIAWEYRRWITITLVAAVPLLVVPSLATVSIVPRVIAKLALTAAFLAAAWRWLQPSERTSVLNYINARRRRS